MEKQKRKRLPKEPDHEYIASELERLLSSDATTDEQKDILSDIILELSNSSNVSVWTPGVVAAFYLVASQYRAEQELRAELLETLKLIEQGEKFEGYQTNDLLWTWKARRRVRELAGNPQLNWRTRRRLQEAADTSKFDLPALVERAEAQLKKGGRSNG